MIKRPLGIVAVLYAFGVLIGTYIPLTLYCILVVSVPVLAGIFLAPRLRPYFIRFLLILVGWTNFAWHTAVTNPNDLRTVLGNDPQLLTIRGTLAETPQLRVYPSDDGETLRTAARLNVTALESSGSPVPGGPASGQITVITPGELPEKFFRGQEVRIYGVIGPPPLPVAEGLFNYREYLRRQGIYFELKAESSNDWQIIGGQNTSPPISDRFKQWAKASLAMGRGEADTPLHLEQALTLGEKAYLSEDLTEPFMQAATYHIFAVDGLRMAILFGIFFTALRRLRMPRNVCSLVILPLLWFYVDLTGWPASAIRAAVMLSIVLIAWMLKRPVDVLNSLFAAALVILLWQPQQLYQAGFQLSFCVVLCIILVMPAFDKLVQRALQFDPLLPDELRPRWQILVHKPIRFACGLIASSLAAWLGSLPLAAYYFHLFTPVSTPANVVAVPLCGAVLVCNCLTLLFTGWLPAAAIFFNYFGWLFMKWILATSIWFAQWPSAYRYIEAPTLFTIVAFYAIFIAAATGWLFKSEWRKRKFTGLCLIIAIWCGQWIHFHSQTHLTVLPLNGGSAIYFEAPGSKNDLLIDCGNDDSVRLVTERYLQAQGVNSIPRIVLTVGAVQQVGGFEQLQSLTPAKKVLTSAVSFRSPAYRKILETTDSTPNLRQIVHPTDVIGNWTVLHPDATNNFTRAEDNALVLLGEIHGTRILLLSQLGRTGQGALLENNPGLRADIVIAGLPEQTEPLNNTLLESLHPALIIISDSKSPAPRHATRALRDRLEKSGVPVVYTSEVGAVKIALKENHWKASTVESQSWTGTPK
jgi:competence protein ComEC